MTFWRGLKDAGLLEEVMEDLEREIQEILTGLEERIQDPPLQVKGQSYSAKPSLAKQPDATISLNPHDIYFAT